MQRLHATCSDPSKQGNICPPHNGIILKNGGSYTECTPFLNSFHFTWTREVRRGHSATPLSTGLCRNTEFLAQSEVLGGGGRGEGTCPEDNGNKPVPPKPLPCGLAGMTCRRKGHHLSQEHFCFRSTGDLYF